MPIRARHIAAIVAIVLAGYSLAGCGAISEKLAAGLSDAIPEWAGDAPPRPGTTKYDEFMRERERKRLEPAPAKDEAVTASTSSSSSELDAVH